MFSNFHPLVRFSGLLSLLVFILAHTFAGSGTVHQSGPNAGQIDFTVKFMFPPDQDFVDGFKFACMEASDILCEATEGQMWFGEITIVGGTSVNSDLADMFVYPYDGRAIASMCMMGPGIPCYALEQPGGRILLYTTSPNSPFFDPLTIAHEMGHLALDLGDEYDEQNYQGACWGIGPCIEFDQTDAVNTCLMQLENPIFNAPPPHELCVGSNHDLVQGDPMIPACTDPMTLACPPPCNTNCVYWNATSCRYESNIQTGHSLNKFGMILDCWSHAATIHPFLNAPANLPSTGSPACDSPTFIDELKAIDQVVLVLDRSYSMRLLPGSGPCAGAGCPEICNNFIDDDGDGINDETDCQNNRLEFVKNTATMFLNLIKGGSFGNPITTDAGLLGFQCTTKELTSGLLPVSSLNYQNEFYPLIQDLKPNGNTAIGDALIAASGMFPVGDELSPNRAIFLLTDGFSNCGTFIPEATANLLESLGTRVFLVTTEDGNDGILGAVAEQTHGRVIHTELASGLMPAMALQVARHLNSGVLIPKLPYQIASTGLFETRRDARDAGSWFNSGLKKGRPNHPTTPTHQSNYFEFLVEEGTTEITLNFAGNMTNMEAYGIRARLYGPSGPNPKSYDTASGIVPPTMSIAKEDFYTMVTLQNPNPGRWYVNLTALKPTGAGQLQTGFITVLAKNRRASMVTSLDRYVLPAPNSGPVNVSIFPSYDTDLRDADLRCHVVWPDGTVVSLPVEDHSGTGAGYLVQIPQTPMEGDYEVRLYMETVPDVTSNNPGESIFKSSPDLSTPVPHMIRTAVETFRVMRRRGHQ